MFLFLAGVGCQFISAPSSEPAPDATPVTRPDPVTEEPPKPLTTMLVMAQADTREALEAQQAALTAELARVAFAMPLKEGYPRIIESDDAPGLPPGQFWLVAGACLNDEATFARTTLRGAVPGAKPRRVDWLPDHDACPDGVLEQDEESEVRFEVPQVGHEGQITTIVFPRREQQSEMDLQLWQGVVVLRDEAGAVIDEQRIANEGAFARLRRLKLEEGLTHVYDVSSNDLCLGSAPSIQVEEGKLSIRASDGKLAIDRAVESTRDQTCPKAPELPQ